MLAVCRREWARFRGTPRLWVLAVIAPLLFGALLLAIFVQRAPQGLPLVLVDNDHSASSRLLARQLSAVSGLRFIARAADLREAGEQVRAGQAYGVVLIPVGFERDLLRAEATQVQFYFNRQMLTAGNLVLRDVRAGVATFSAGVSLAQGVPPAVLGELHAAFNPGTDYSRFLALPLALAVLHIAIMVVAIDVTGRELREGSAGQWLASAGGRVGRALLGKLLPYALWFFVLGAASVAVTLRLLGIAFEGSVGLALLTWLGLILACIGLGLFLVVLTGNLRLATSVSSLIVSPAFAFGGLTFPVAYMPAPAQFWAWLLPLTHGLAGYVQQLSMGARPGLTLLHVGALLLFASLPLWFFPRWRRLLSDPACWGRT